MTSVYVDLGSYNFSQVSPLQSPQFCVIQDLVAVAAKKDTSVLRLGCLERGLVTTCLLNHESWKMKIEKNLLKNLIVPPADKVQLPRVLHDLHIFVCSSFKLYSYTFP